VWGVGAFCFFFGCNSASRAEATTVATLKPPGRIDMRKPISDATKAAVRARDGNRCVICRQTNDTLEIDHVLPVRAGGTDDLDNLRLVCRAFNRGGRCPSLRTAPPKRKRQKRPATPPAGSLTTEKPTLTVDIQISRQFTFHQLVMPHDPIPSYHRWFHQAIEQAELAGYPTLTIVIDDDDYLLQLHPGE
jgi:hypothetical protein